MLDCNNEEGVCIIDKVNLSNKIKTISDELTVMYIGDPMCSRCWGISPILKIFIVRNLFGFNRITNKFDILA